MIPDFQYSQGDQEPVFAQTLTYDDGSLVNLEGATLGLIMRSLASEEPLTLAGPVVGVVPSGLAVKCQIQWTVVEADSAAIAPGVYLGKWSVLFSAGQPMTFPTKGFLWIEVEESLTDTQLSIGVRPSNQQVAGLLRARTKAAGGKELGVFADGQTRPGATEVEGLIDDALDEVLGKVVGIDSTQVPGSAYNAPGSRYERRIRGAVALYAAVLIETSYWPEQVRATQSPVTVYQQLYSSRIKSLIAEDKTGQPEGMGDSTGSGGGDSPADAAWAFPANTGGLIGWSTRW